MPSTAMILHLVADASAGDMSRAVEIASVGMLMVFSALAFLTVFLTFLPRMLGWINAVWPEASEHHPSDAEILEDEDDVMAAIGFVLHIENRELP